MDNIKDLKEELEAVLSKLGEAKTPEEVECLGRVGVGIVERISKIRFNRVTTMQNSLSVGDRVGFIVFRGVTLSKSVVQGEVLSINIMSRRVAVLKIESNDGGYEYIAKYVDDLFKIEPCK